MTNLEARPDPDPHRGCFPARPDSRVLAGAVSVPDYLAPEQITSQGKPSHKTDLHALGAILHHMLTGQSPVADKPKVLDRLQAIADRNFPSTAGQCWLAPVIDAWLQGEWGQFSQADELLKHEKFVPDADPVVDALTRRPLDLTDGVDSFVVEGRAFEDAMFEAFEAVGMKSRAKVTLRLLKPAFDKPKFVELLRGLPGKTVHTADAPPELLRRYAAGRASPIPVFPGAVVSVAQDFSGGGVPCLIEEFAGTKTLQAALEGPGFKDDAGRVARIARQLLRGLSHAHKHGAIHARLTPYCIFLLDPGDVVRIDGFGLHAEAERLRLNDGGNSLRTFQFYGTTYWRGACPNQPEEVCFRRFEGVFNPADVWAGGASFNTQVEETIVSIGAAQQEPKADGDSSNKAMARSSVLADEILQAFRSYLRTFVPFPRAVGAKLFEAAQLSLVYDKLFNELRQHLVSEPKKAVWRAFGETEQLGMMHSDVAFDAITAHANKPAVRFKQIDYTAILRMIQEHAAAERQNWLAAFDSPNTPRMIQHYLAKSFNLPPAEVDLIGLVEKFQDLGSCTDEQSLLDTWAARVHELFPEADGCFVVGRVGPDGYFVPRTAGPRGNVPWFSQSVARRALDAAEATIADPASEAEFRDRSVMTAPVRAGDEVVGVAFVTANRATREFGPRDLRILAAATAAAGSILNILRTMT